MHIYRNGKLFATLADQHRQARRRHAERDLPDDREGQPGRDEGPRLRPDGALVGAVHLVSGDYLHDAYWSVGEQGFANVSHGCVNLSPADAETYYKLAVPGDPVTITGSPRAGAWDNGWTVWFLSWNQLLHGSATGWP